jgi:hypothetical protein
MRFGLERGQHVRVFFDNFHLKRHPPLAELSRQGG